MAGAITPLEWIEEHLDEIQVKYAGRWIGVSRAEPHRVVSEGEHVGEVAQRLSPGDPIPYFFKVPVLN